ncbi:Glycosyltransferase BC10 [Linum grandiflorum]
MSLPLFTERRSSRTRRLRSMTRKTPPQLLALVSPPHRRWKLSILFFISLLAILNLHFYYSSFSPVDTSSNLSRSTLPLSFRGPPKIAFLFLVRHDLPLDFVWAAFFDAAGVPSNFSIFLHSSSPGFILNQSTTRSPHFYGRHLNTSIQVKWGESSMLQAEKLLLAAALDDPANRRFILLSDSCVPLYNFTYIYNYLMASPRSFVDSFLDMKEGRYNPKMSPIIPMHKWRKGSQWITLIRSHAEVVVDDDVILAVFKKFCKMSGVENELERRTVTYTEWHESANTMENTGWHPTTFTYANAGPDKIKTIKDIDHVYYETEYRTEWCHSNSTSVPCFLFGRKFSRGAAMRILSDGLVGPFDASTLLSTTPLPPT